MRKINLNQAGRYLLFILLSGINMVVFGQDTTITTQKTTTTSEFVIQPWMYIAVGVIALITIAALVSSSGRKEVIKTTIVKDNRS